MVSADAAPTGGDQQVVAPAAIDAVAEIARICCELSTRAVWLSNHAAAAGAPANGKAIKDAPVSVTVNSKGW